jgi:multidrug efflux pump subunit AcrB
VKLVEVTDVGSRRSTSHFCFGPKNTQLHCQMVDPDKLKAFNVSLQDVAEAAEKANVNAPGGFLIHPDQEMLIREVGRNDRSLLSARDGTSGTWGRSR